MDEYHVLTSVNSTTSYANCLRCAIGGINSAARRRLYVAGSSDLQHRLWHPQSAADAATGSGVGTILPSDHYLVTTRITRHTIRRQVNQQYTDVGQTRGETSTSEHGRHLSFTLVE